MGAFNVLQACDVECPECGTTTLKNVQFRYGETWQHSYVLGAPLQWGRNDIGEAGAGDADVLGSIDSACDICGFDDDWYVVIAVRGGRLQSVATYTGQHDLVDNEDGFVFLAAAATAPEEV